MDILSLVAGFLAGALTIYLASYFMKPSENKTQKRSMQALSICSISCGRYMSACSTK